MKHFLFISLPNISAFFVNPKCLFIVVNVIVVFLVGESRLVGSNSSPVDEIRDQYVERSCGLRGHSSSALQLQEIKEEGSTSEVHDNGDCQVLLEQKEERKFTDQDGVNMVEDKEVLKEEEEEEVVKAEGDDDHEEEEEEEAGLPAEELKKRAEEFIARVNKQMWLEPK
ncbi:hypothetical protein FH972_009391 [Carpinus fangiana]|uniref:DUF4408 domain-containing protein n=1 Tax=Carpinus fangiana TaxID=176857 RepID=A0A5N6R1R6_9ROSI|nr:hypothetical protein FH972_009391 [Carpinus fangiana]